VKNRLGNEGSGVQQLSRGRRRERLWAKQTAVAEHAAGAGTRQCSGARWLGATPRRGVAADLARWRRLTAASCTGDDLDGALASVGGRRWELRLPVGKGDGSGSGCSQR
jgi:hypothetical protein